MNTLYDELIEIIKEKQLEIGNKNKEPIPSIYYIGMPKTASASLMVSFPNNSVAHWHDTEYFETLYKTRILSKNNKDLIDLVKYIGKKYDFIPLIVECIREPISNLLSLLMQHIKKERRNCKCDLCVWRDTNRNWDENLLKLVKNNLSIGKWIKNIHSLESWKKHFRLEVTSNFHKYSYKKLKLVKLLLIRFEDVKDRPNLFKKLKYEYEDKTKNLNEKNEFIKGTYDYIKENITFTEKELDVFYENEIYKKFYTEQDTQVFKEKYLFKEIIAPIKITEDPIESDTIDWRGKYLPELDENINNVIELVQKEDRSLNDQIKIPIIPISHHHFKRNAFSFSHLQYLQR